MGGLIRVSVKVEVRCPAASLDLGTLSLNEQDVRCGITGLIRAAEGSPCCDAYTRCSIWVGEKERIWMNKRASKAEKLIHSGSGTWL
jgi:hypothetical protein